MNVTVNIPASLQRLSGGAGAVSLTADTLADGLARLSELYPALGASIFGAGGRPLSFVRIFVNARDCSRLDGIEVRLADGDSITLMPAFAGG